MPRLPPALLPGALLTVVWIAALPLGTLHATLLLVVALPLLAVSLAALGAVDLIAAALARIGAPRRAPLLAYGAWLAVSALLGLDAAAVLSVPVGLRLARRGRGSEHDQLSAAIYGSNVGSLLFPFSNLTNLMLVATTGIGFGAYVAAAALPQLAAALAVGALLAVRREAVPDVASDVAPRSAPSLPTARRRVVLAAGGVTAASGAVALVLGFTGGDVALPFVAASAVVAGIAIAEGVLGAPAAVRSIPLGAVGIVFGAALVGFVVRATPAGELVPHWGGGSGPLGLLAVTAVGGVLASLLNNLPAALIGSIWLVGAPPPVVVAFLVGTNLTALLTPHGSVATMLCRSLARLDGHSPSRRAYLATAWRYAGAATVSASLLLVLVG